MKIFLFILAFSSMAFAQDCSEKNLITEPNSPFDKIPVYDQAGSGMCYAFATSELVNYQLIKNGSANSPVVHPAWLGMNGSAAGKQEDMRGGYVTQSLEAVKNRMNCPYENVTNSIGALAKTVGVPEGKILKFIDDYGNVLKEALNHGKMSRSLVTQSLRAAAHKNLVGCSYADWQKIFPKLENLTGSGVEIAQQLMAQSCRPENLTPLNLPLPQTSKTGSDQDLELELFRTLERGQPSTMIFCSWATDRAAKADLRNVRVNQWGYRDYINPSKDVCGSHIAMVAGKKMLNNSCHFLYLNSKGSGWNGDNRHLTCLCRKRSNGEFVDGCKFATHNNGQYTVEACWVPAQVLVPNTVEISHY